VARRRRVQQQPREERRKDKSHYEGGEESYGVTSTARTRAAVATPQTGPQASRSSRLPGRQGSQSSASAAARQRQADGGAACSAPTRLSHGERRREKTKRLTVVVFFFVVVEILKTEAVPQSAQSECVCVKRQEQSPLHQWRCEGDEERQRKHSKVVQKK
jgi:hypothetical protein